MGLVAPGHVGSWFPDQGSNPRPLHWKADSSPLGHQGSPVLEFFPARCQGPSLGRPILGTCWRPSSHFPLLLQQSLTISVCFSWHGTMALQAEARDPNILRGTVPQVEPLSHKWGLAEGRTPHILSEFSQNLVLATGSWGVG